MQGCFPYILKSCPLSFPQKGPPSPQERSIFFLRAARGRRTRFSSKPPPRSPRLGAEAGRRAGCIRLSPGSLTLRHAPSSAGIRKGPQHRRKAWPMPSSWHRKRSGADAPQCCPIPEKMSGRHVPGRAAGRFQHAPSPPEKSSAHAGNARLIPDFSRHGPLFVILLTNINKTSFFRRTSSCSDVLSKRKPVAFPGPSNTCTPYCSFLNIVMFSAFLTPGPRMRHPWQERAAERDAIPSMPLVRRKMPAAAVPYHGNVPLSRLSPSPFTEKGDAAAAASPFSVNGIP